MRSFVLFLGFSVLVTAPSLATDAPSAAPTAQPAATATQSAAPASAAPGAQAATTETEEMLNQTICKKQPPPTGSRLGARTICMTNREWRDRTARTQQVITDMQQKGLGIVPGN